MDACVESVSPGHDIEKSTEARTWFRMKWLNAAGKFAIRRPCVACIQTETSSISREPGRGATECVRSILETYAPVVQTTVSGAFYLDFSASEQLDPHLESTLLRLQMEILGRTGLRVCIGAGRTRLMALLAARSAQPRGVRIVNAVSEVPALAALPVATLDGIGDIRSRALVERGISNIGELRSLPKPVLIAQFGEPLGIQLWCCAHGKSAVSPEPKWAWRDAFAAMIFGTLANWAHLGRRKATGFAELAGGTPSLG